MRPRSLKTLRPSQGSRVSSRIACEGLPVGLEGSQPAPGHAAFGEAQAGEALGEGLARVAEVVQALVAGEEARRARERWQTFS